MTTATAAPRTDQGAIVEALRVIMVDGQVTELRALDALTGSDRWPRTVSGYFDTDHLPELAKAAASIKSAKGVYFLPNPVKPSLLARAPNLARPIGKTDPTTSDHDILCRRWFLVDCDPVRPAGISATDDEHDEAHALAKRIIDHMAADGWPCPIYADSGNGAHLMYRVDLPTDDAGLLERCLVALDKRFSTDAIKVDLTVFNPARLWKLYGTMSGKGYSTFERPHRISRFLEAPK